MLFVLAWFFIFLDVGMNKILSFLVETEFLTCFNKQVKINCIVSFYKKFAYK